GALNPVLVATVIQLIVSDLSVVLQAKNIEIEINCPDDFTVLADSNMLKLAIKNLIVNAVKFSHQGGKVQILASSSGHSKIIQIIDYGVGMDNETKSKLFQPDIKSKPGTNQERGTGLGLVQCHDFILKMKGSISCKSDLGVGTSFTILLKAAQ
ncbi:MAG: HAMP domain-containing histidine kinase, partial [Bacteroidetes bacterium]|nr:HAMP domain-containing histidine kinase [Bacteroidota bacterium]